MHDICTQGLGRVPMAGKRVPVLIPDHTRHAPIPLFFRYANVNVFKHEHENPTALRTIGTIGADELYRLSGGWVGFSEGNKYFFSSSCTSRLRGLLSQ